MLIVNIHHGVFWRGSLHRGERHPYPFGLTHRLPACTQEPSRHAALLLCGVLDLPPTPATPLLERLELLALLDHTADSPQVAAERLSRTSYLGQMLLHPWFRPSQQALSMRSLRAVGVLTCRARCTVRCVPFDTVHPRS